MKNGLYVLIALGSIALAGCSKWSLSPKEVSPNGSNTGSGSVFSKGQILIPILKGYDLDAGSVQADGSSPSDFYWNVEQTSGRSRGELYAHNGSRFTITTLDQSQISSPPSTLYTTLTRLTYSDNSIATDAATPIRAGTVIAYVTNEGRYGAFRVDRLGTDMTLTITWLTYNK